MLDFAAIMARLVPFKLGSAIARRLLEVLGFGAGTDVGSSGEILAMKRAFALAGIDGSATPLLFDVGANIGEWTMSSLRAFPTAKIVAFEPSEAHRTAFGQVVSGNHSVILEPLALAAERSVATLYKDMSISGLASLTKRDLSHVGIDMNMTEQVATETLDLYLEDHRVLGVVDYLKIDVEGHELDVLKGAAKALSSGRIRIVQFEFGGTSIDTRTYFKDFFNLLTAHGFRIYIVRPGGLLAPIDRYREFYEQFRTTNFVAISNKPVSVGREIAE